MINLDELEALASANSWFQAGSGAQVFRNEFDRRPFLFSHSLHTHPLLGFPMLAKLAEKWARDDKERGFFRLSNETRGLGWGSPEFQAALNAAFGDIEGSKMRLKLSSIHLEPEYNAMLSRCTQELSDLTSVDLPRTYRDRKATVFITSPNEVTHFHVDEEANFLLQIYGNKTVYIFDGNDRELLPWHELEDYWQSGTIRFREELQSRAYRFELRPGLGVHNPVHFPHWVQNGSSPSVSLSFGFTRSQSPVDVLRVNHYLRKLGVSPTPPGENSRLDGAKRAMLRGARFVKKALGRS